VDIYLCSAYLLFRWKDLKEESDSKLSHFKLMDKKKCSQLLEKTTKIKRLESDLETERVRLESQVAAAVTLVSRTKDFVISLQEQKNNSLKHLQELKDKSHALFVENEQLHSKDRVSTQEISILKDRLANLLQNNLEIGLKATEERRKLEIELQSLQIEKEDILRSNEVLRNQTDTQKKKSDEMVDLQREINTLK